MIDNIIPKKTQNNNAESLVLILTFIYVEKILADIMYMYFSSIFDHQTSRTKMISYAISQTKSYNNKEDSEIVLLGYVIYQWQLIALPPVH